MDVKILSSNEEEIEMRDLEDEEEVQQADTLNISESNAQESQTVGSKE